MNKLECKKCGTMTNCSEEAVAITCSSCVNEGLDGLVNVLDSAVDRLSELVA